MPIRSRSERSRASVTRATRIGSPWQLRDGPRQCVAVLLSDHANRVELRPLRYQLPRAGANSYDDDRLVIGGTVTTAEGRWSFAGPCLLVDEAREVAVPGHVVHRARPGLRPRRPERGWGGGSGPPVLGSGAPWQQGDDRADVYQHSVEVAVTTAALLRAADRWDAGLASLPAR
ncbi:WapI family immunity protein [Streptomyces vinaceus]|uniref:WapI family immunity protein n=1 Tax=Streptomyces vinaceus TaxID=1960 RepID=UPI00406431F1